MSLLVGRRIVVTRADEQADAMCDALDAAGAVPVRCPTIRITAPSSLAGLDAALDRIAGYDWVVFTSANGVRTTYARAEERGPSLAGPHLLRVAASGGVAADALAERGVAVDFLPKPGGSSSLARSLPDVEGSSILLLIGDKTDPLLRRVLTERGASRVDVVTAYETVPVAPAGAGLAELEIGVDAVTFSSPATVEGFLSLGPDWRGLIRRAVVVTIGPTTTAAAMAQGVGVHAEAKERTAAALIDAVSLALSMATRRR